MKIAVMKPGKAFHDFLIDIYRLCVLTGPLSVLEDPGTAASDSIWTRTLSPMEAPNEPIDIALVFEKGVPVKLQIDSQTLEDKLDKTALQNDTSGKESPDLITGSLEIFQALNEIGRVSGVGRIGKLKRRSLIELCFLISHLPDIVEDRFIGLKSRGVSILEPLESIVTSSYADFISVTTHQQ